MKKEAYYFPHDCNARNDERILAVRMRYGAEGYGIFFMIIERLRESSNYMSIKDYNMIAFDFRVGTDKVKSIIEDFGLFTFTEDGKCFYSESLLNRMKPLNNMRAQRSEAGRSSARKRSELNENPTPVERSLANNSTVVDQKSNKEKYSKVKENKEEIPPNPHGGKPVSKSQKKEFDLIFVDVAYIGIVKDFIQYRKQIKKPFKTEKGVRMFFDELVKLSGNNIQKAKQLSEYAKGKEWLTVYEVKESPKSAHPASNYQTSKIEEDERW